MRFLASLLALAVLASCTTGKQPLPTRPTASAVAPKVQNVTLAGTVKLLAAPAISDNGAGAISDNGAGIISNNSGALVSDHGSGLISNNGSGLTAKTKRALLQTGAPREFLLADAVITLTDASGKAVTDAAGKPLTVTTDAKGNYSFAAALPAKNLVMHVTLHDGGNLHGGELTALLPRDNAAKRAIDTASSLGAAYVLGKYVAGSQTTFDKLPASASQRLDAAIAGALAGTAKAPGYQTAELVQQADALRGQAPAVASALDDIKALLLGQAKLGAGRKATEVALSGPVGLVLRPDGSLLVCENILGRIRSVAPDGTIGTFADPARGEVKQGFLDTLDLTRAPDGTLYVATYGQVQRVGTDGKVTAVAGTTKREQGAVDVPAMGTDVTPGRLAVASDGTLYIGEEAGLGALHEGRLLYIGTDGILHRRALPDTFKSGQIQGLAFAPDDTLYVLYEPLDGGTGRIYRLPPGKPGTTVATGLPGAGDLVLGADGTLYLSDRVNHTLLAIGADGKRTAIAGTGGPADRAAIAPDALAIAPDGTLFVADFDHALVYKLGPDGATTQWAGATLGSQAGSELHDVALNQPVGAAFDAHGNLLMTEGGSRSLVRFDGHGLTRLTAGGHGDGGDGGPLSGALFGNPSGLAVHGDEIFIVDGERGRLRKVAADGTISTIVGPGVKREPGLEHGERVPAALYGLNDGGLAIDAKGTPYFSRNLAAQVFRLAADGLVEAPVGAPPSIWTQAMVNSPASILTDAPTDGMPAADTHLFRPLGLAFDSKGALYIADLQGMRVRKVTGLDGPNPVISTFAGVGAAGTISSPDGLSIGKQEGIQARDAALVLPFGVAVDAHDNVYVTEVGTVNLPATYALGVDLSALPAVPARIRRITPDGVITTIAGPGGKLFPDPAAEDGLGLPTGLAVAADGRLAIVDPGANLVHILPAGSY